MYQKQILEYAKKNPVFLITEIQDCLKISAAKRAVFNSEINRIEKTGQIKRLAHGIYAVPIQSCFGSTLPNEHTVVNHVYIDNGKGYVTGPSFLNQIGVSTWVPQKTYVKVNNIIKSLTLDSLVITRSRIHISMENQKYLQLLDGILDAQQYAIDNTNPNKIFYDYIIRNRLDTTKLLLMANKLYKRPVQDKLYEILSEYYFD